MATRFLTTRRCYLKCITECRKITTQRMNYCVLKWSKGLTRIPSSSQAHYVFQEHGSRLHASTSTRHPDMSKLSGRNFDFCREVLQCTSSEEILNITSKKTIVPSRELVTTLNCLTNKKYNELCEELPWLSSNRFRAHVQLRLCYDIPRKMSAIHGHPGSNVLLESLDKQKESMSNEDLGSALSSLSLLNFNEVWPYYERVYEELSKRVQTFSIRDIRKASEAGRVHSFTHNESTEDMDTFCNKLLIMLKNLLESNTVQTQRDSYDFMLSLLILHRRTEMKTWDSLCECVFDSMSTELATSGNPKHTVLVSQFGRLLNKHEVSEELIHNILHGIIKHAGVFTIDEIYTVGKALRSKLPQTGLQTALHQRAVELYRQHEENMRPADLIDLLYGFSYILGSHIRQDIEQRIWKCDLKSMDVFAMADLSYNIPKFDDHNLIMEVQNLWIDHVKELTKYGSCLKPIVTSLQLKQFQDKHTEEVFVRRMLEETGKNPVEGIFRIANLANVLIPHLHGRDCEQLIDYLIQSLPEFRLVHFSIVWEGLGKVKMVLLDPEMREKMKKLQGLFHSYSVERMRRELCQGDISAYVNLAFRLAAKDQRYANLFVPVIKEHMAIAGTNVITQLASPLRKANYFDEELYEQIADVFIANSDLDPLFMPVLSLFGKNGFIPKDKDGFVSRVMSIYQQVGAVSVELIVPILYNLAMMEYFPKNELKHFFSVESLGELDIRVEKNAWRRRKCEEEVFNLNRAVVLECPELNIPFCSDSFFTKYILPASEQKSIRTQRFTREVYLTLLELVDGNKLCIDEWIFSPYYHLINFEMLLDECGNPVPLNQSDDESKEGLQRVAVLLLDRFEFATNTNRLLGRGQVQQRHLEIMGYKVVQVREYEWNSMALSSKGARRQYLREKVCGQSNRAKVVKPRVIDVRKILK